ncbi:MAG: hypothetical protein IIV50_02540 [Muribaculaceae bacterium]|nr:hypothetical protein [Muribaculaceae bacterium]
MKKLALSLAVLFRVAMVSCGNAEKAADSCCDTTVVEETVEVVDTNAVDTNAVDTAAADTNK